MDFLDQGTKQLYQSREQDLQKLERMQEDFFKGMTEFTLDQQKKQQEFQHQMQAEYAARQTKLEEQHRERLNQLEAKEADLKKIRADIDERENRQARRDIYKEIKAKLEARNQKFELTEGTQNRRRVVFWFTLGLIFLFLCGFGYCFYTDVVGDHEHINWAAIGSQIGFALRADRLCELLHPLEPSVVPEARGRRVQAEAPRLGHRPGELLVELAMEWKNIMKSEIPAELIDKLARSLFVSEETKDMDIHPAETFLSALFGKAGSINVEFPGRLTMQRSEVGKRQKKR